MNRAQRRAERSAARRVPRGPIFTDEAALLAAVLAKGGGKVYHLLVGHDPGCTRARCTCQPDFELRAGTAENIAEGAALEAAWIAETAS